jgi:uroporphyrinogen decarboxylase
MNSKDRVIKALDFERTDRVPRNHPYWDEFETAYKIKKGWVDVNLADVFKEDIFIAYPDEGPFPSLKSDGPNDEGNVYHERDSWGRVFLRKRDAKFLLVTDAIIKEYADLDKLTFEPADLDSRYANVPNMEALKQRYCVFLKIGGFFQRTSWLRGEEEFLVDTALEPSFAAELASRTADHILGVGLEALKRWQLYDTGVWLFDDIGSTRGPVVSPKAFEHIFYPQYKKVISALKAAGAQKILFHSDGNIESILDMLLDAGVEVINPVEQRSGMNPVLLRKKYGRRLGMIGCIDNVHILPSGTKSEIEKMTREVLELARDGGIVVGVHSLGDDIPVENIDFYFDLLDKYGQFDKKI